MTVLTQKWIACIALVVSSVLFAAEPIEEPHGFFPTDSVRANWVFSGMVTNENGESYDYLFQLQRDDHDFHAIVALIDAQTKKVILQEDSQAHFDTSELYNWTVGRAFLRFNSINDSWVFGLYDQNKHGFNFKVDMLNQPEHDPVTQYFRHGISFVVVQTGQLNGHIQVGDDKEQFVTAKNAWFRQIWLTNTKHSSSVAAAPCVAGSCDKASLPKSAESVVKDTNQLNGLLCRFNDGSGLYSMKVLEADSLRGAVAGLFNTEGLSTAVSQFIHVEQKEDSTWSIRISSPKMHLMLTDLIKQHEITAGFVSEKDKQGFCMLSQETH